MRKEPLCAGGQGGTQEPLCVVGHKGINQLSRESRLGCCRWGMCLSKGAKAVDRLGTALATCDENPAGGLTQL